VGSKIGNKKRVVTRAQNDCIEIRGARQNNLKGIDVDLPLGKLTVITGPSGSGKSSLAFQTIYAEGQRRYVETFSPYMRQFLDRMDKPRVDFPINRRHNDGNQRLFETSLAAHCARVLSELQS
jgi:archaellum biogenesis ATPase FlaH